MSLFLLGQFVSRSFLGANLLFHFVSIHPSLYTSVWDVVDIREIVY